MPSPTPNRTPIPTPAHTRPPVATPAAPAAKPRLQKPYPQFPLTPHPRGYFVKKYKGKVYNLGADPDAALLEWSRIKAAADAATNPAIAAIRGATVAGIVNAFLTDAQRRVDAGKLTARQFSDDRKDLERFVQVVGRHTLCAELKAIHFAADADAAQARGPRAFSKHIATVRKAFGFALDEGLIDSLPIFGRAYRGGNKREARERRAARFVKAGQTFQPREIHQLLNAATPVMRACILLAINCGFRADDLSGLRESNIDRDAMMIRYPRPKTKILRAVPIWPETLDAIDAAKPLITLIRNRLPPAARKAVAGHLFLTPGGAVVARDIVHRDDKGIRRVSRYDWIQQHFVELCKMAGIDRGGRGFSAFRATFRTAAVGAPYELVKIAMGQHITAVDEHYIGESLVHMHKVTDQVKAWLGPIAARRIPQGKVGLTGRVVIASPATEAAPTR